jgi:tetratricopeptide (TPR) repeat protein
VLAFVLVAAPVLLPAPPAGAQAQGQHAQDRARQHFAAGEYREALAIYRELHERTRHPTYLRNIARCHQKLGEADEALARFREYLETARNLTPAQRAEIDGYIAEMEQLKRPPAGAPASPAAPAPPSASVPEPPSAPAPAAAPAPQPAVPAARVSEAPDTARPGAPPPGSPPAPVAGRTSPEAHLAAAPPSAAPAGAPIYKRPWFWVGVAAIVTGAVAAAIVLGSDRSPELGNLGGVDLRDRTQ